MYVVYICLVLWQVRQSFDFYIYHHWAVGLNLLCLKFFLHYLALTGNRVCVCVCVCVCVRMCVCSWVFACDSYNVHMCVHVCSHLYAIVCGHTHISACTFVYLHLYVHVPSFPEYSMKYVCICVFHWVWLRESFIHIVFWVCLNKTLVSVKQCQVQSGDSVPD